MDIGKIKLQHIVIMEENDFRIRTPNIYIMEDMD